jgi:hypothetical protein
VKIVSGDTIHVFVNGDVERVATSATAPDPGDGGAQSGDPRDAGLEFNRG